MKTLVFTAPFYVFSCLPPLTPAARTPGVRCPACLLGFNGQYKADLLPWRTEKVKHSFTPAPGDLWPWW